MIPIIIAALVIFAIAIAATWLLSPTFPHYPTHTHVDDRTLDRYHRTRDRSAEEPRAARRLE